MIPSVTKKGTSFKGAASYYFHDKKAQTKTRIDFTHTQNLPTDDPDMAAKMMAYTAMHQSEIKQATGGVAKGRKLTQPVYAYSLAWHPSQDPAKEHMIEAGLNTLKILGLHEHEAVMAAHNDEPHKHLHIVVNRVHPETGIAAKLSNDRLKLSKWAEKYEREHGQIFCEERVENNKRRKSEYVKHREDLSKAEYHRWQRDKTREAFEKRQSEEKELSSLHKKQRDDLYKAKTDLIKERLSDIKEENRPIWAGLYRQQEQEREGLKDELIASQNRLKRLLKDKDRGNTLYDTKGVLTGVFKADTGKNNISRDLNDRHENERKRLAFIISAQKRDVYKQINDDYSRNLEILKERQINDQIIQKTRQTQESQKRAADIASGKAREEFERERKAQTLQEEYNKKSGVEPPEVKKEFNEKREFTVFRDMKEQRECVSNDNQKKDDSGITKEFNVFRKMKEEREREKERDKGGGPFTNKSAGREPG